MPADVPTRRACDDRQWFIVGRWQEYEGEGRANLLRIAATFEPGAAAPGARLAQAAELAGVRGPIEARLDPILPGVTDDADCLESLCVALARAGVRAIAASVLFLRPAVAGSLRRYVTDEPLLNRRFASVPARTPTSPMALATSRAGRCRRRLQETANWGCSERQRAGTGYSVDRTPRGITGLFFLRVPLRPPR